MSPPDTKTIMLPSGESDGSAKLGRAVELLSVGGAASVACASAAALPRLNHTEAEQARPINTLARNFPPRRSWNEAVTADAGRRRKDIIGSRARGLHALLRHIPPPLPFAIATHAGSQNGLG